MANTMEEERAAFTLGIPKYGLICILLDNPEIPAKPNKYDK